MSHANIPRSRRFSLDTTVSSIREFGFGANFDPLTLFKDGKQGVWYDPSDKSTLFQDEAGTVPVTKDGDPVGLIKDKSGNNNHASQPLAASRPIYKTDGNLHWLEFDGADDYLTISNLPEIPQPLSVYIAKAENYKATIAYLDATVGTLSRFSDTYWSVKFGSGSTDKQIGNLRYSLKILMVKVNGVSSTINGDGNTYNIVSGNDAMKGNVSIFGRSYGNNMSGLVYSLIVCPSPINDNNVSQYLVKKAGVTL